MARYADAARDFNRRAVDTQHRLRLKKNERQRNAFGWMIEMFHRQSELRRHFVQAFFGKVPEMLRWRHQSPLRPRPPRCDRCKISGRDYDNPAGLYVAVAERQHFPRLW